MAKKNDLIVYPVRLKIDYPQRKLDRLTSFFRIILAVPNLITLPMASGHNADGEGRDSMRQKINEGGFDEHERLGADNRLPYSVLLK